MATNLTFSTGHTNVVEIIAVFNESFLLVSEMPVYKDYEQEIEFADYKRFSRRMFNIARVFS